MLAADLDGVDLTTLRYPLMGSPKLDGIRMIVQHGVAYSRNGKPIRNRFVQALYSGLHGFDGEIIVGSPTEGEVLNRTQSGVMSFDGKPDVTYHLFDNVDVDMLCEPYFKRWDSLRLHDDTELVPQIILHNVEALMEFETEVLNAGYEGVILRDPQSPYKHGRSTLNQGWMMKLKRFIDGEGVVAYLEEGYTNNNPLERTPLGFAKRSSNREGLVPNGMVGAMILTNGMRVAPGLMPHSMRKFYWTNPAQLVGKRVHWRAFGYGQKNTPRFARFYNIREDDV